MIRMVVGGDCMVRTHGRTPRARWPDRDVAVRTSVVLAVVGQRLHQWQGATKQEAGNDSLSRLKRQVNAAIELAQTASPAPACCRAGPIPVTSSSAVART